jgi:hypothetical protein
VRDSTDVLVRGMEDDDEIELTIADLSMVVQASIVIEGPGESRVQLNGHTECFISAEHRRASGSRVSVDLVRED